MSMFGRPAAPAFGTSTGTLGQPAPTNSLFGQTMNQPQAQTQPQMGAFGSSLLGQPVVQQQPQQQQQQQPGASSFLGASQAMLQNRGSIWEPGRESLNHKPVTEQMETIIGKWAPNNPNTVFKYYFYNHVGQARVPFFQPGPGEDPREWEQAAHDKPDPGYVPVLAAGFAAVLRNRGYSLDKDEDELKTKLETLDQGLTDPALSARTEELWSRLLLLRGYADTLRNEIERGTEAQEGLGEEAEAKAKKILEDYDKQLQTLKTQVESIKKDFGEWQAETTSPSKP
ncbi:hypothetical protein E0Z10_g5088 [Xylaria hypoxylon]|uniref:Nucleoporin Nup54 alpha-helical domain-containing protein n=1 Tax=Xylaria hypoxylon TaxID=37992 RepID=A0A4Z0YWZ9_9PEZI|nr:hypothetical protein E0Z10_g5088 [Xylaria hypoxylon]